MIPKGFIMATKKQPKSWNGRTGQTAPAAGGFAIVLSTALRTALNMIVVVVTSGSALLFLLAAKRFLSALQSSLILSVQVKTRI
jgi:hypothetical protein